jgi:hypothetical protein
MYRGKEESQISKVGKNDIKVFYSSDGEKAGVVLLWIKSRKRTWGKNTAKDETDRQSC